MKIKLTQGKTTIIDDEDFEKISGYSWHYNKKSKNCGYVQTAKYINVNKSETIYLHRLIMDVPKGMVIDHINHDTLDNRKVNLRICTQQENTMNTSSRKNSTSKYLGVHLHNGTGKWCSQIKRDGKIRHLGLFKTEKAAYNARLKFIEENGGEPFA